MTPATLHHLADALTALRLAHDVTADMHTLDLILGAETECLRAVRRAAHAAIMVDLVPGDE